MEIIPTYTGFVPYITSAQMIEVDRAMIEDYQILLVQMMENAGHALAELARQRFLEGNPRGKQVLVIAGNGGNGGGALVSARRLANYGAEVKILLSKQDIDYVGVPGQQLSIIKQMGLNTHSSHSQMDNGDYDLIIDGLIGYSLLGAPHGTAAEIIVWVNKQNCPVLSLDIPSGIDADRGAIYEPAIKATATLTLALPKVGMKTSAANPYIGELYLADISIPPGLYAKDPLNLAMGNIFSEADIIKLP